jgi:hypothetical protein
MSSKGAPMRRRFDRIFLAQRPFRAVAAAAFTILEILNETLTHPR